MTASCALRHGVFDGVRKRFLASCCEIVEPPALREQARALLALALSNYER